MSVLASVGGVISQGITIPVFQAASSFAIDPPDPVEGSWPAGTLVGDLLIVAAVCDANLSTPTMSGSGAALSVVRYDGGSTGQEMQVCSRIVAPGDASPITWAFPSSDDVVGVCLRYSPGASSPPVDTHATATGGSSGTLTAPTVTATRLGILICLFSIRLNDGDALAVTPGPGLTLRADGQIADNFGLVAADEILGGSGATGPRTVTIEEGASWRATSVVI